MGVGMGGITGAQGDGISLRCSVFKVQVLLHIKVRHIWVGLRKRTTLEINILESTVVKSGA